MHHGAAGAVDVAQQPLLLHHRHVDPPASQSVAGRQLAEQRRPVRPGWRRAVPPRPTRGEVVEAVEDRSQRLDERVLLEHCGAGRLADLATAPRIVEQLDEGSRQVVGGNEVLALDQGLVPGRRLGEHRAPVGHRFHHARPFEVAGEGVVAVEVEEDAAARQAAGISSSPNTVPGAVPSTGALNRNSRSCTSRSHSSGASAASVAARRGVEPPRNSRSRSRSTSAARIEGTPPSWRCIASCPRRGWRRHRAG